MPLCGVQGLGPSDPEAVEAGRKGLWEETPEGAVGKAVMKGGGYRGCFGFPGGRGGGLHVFWEG